MNPGLSQLQSYPFEKLARLLEGARPPAGRPLIDLSIGEPAHPTPPFIHRMLIEDLATTARYPATRGTPELRAAVARWLNGRFALDAMPVDPDTQVLPLNGTREGLFSITQCVVDRRRTDGLVLMPNPCYQIYEGAALLAGAQPYFLNLLAERDYQPDFAAVPEAIWRRCQLLILCSPHNPTGAVLPLPVLGELIGLARRHDFVIVADECYSELYADERSPPPGILGAAARRPDGRAFAHCLSVHSLSKRSNVPGLRSGFIAGDPALIAEFYRYRTYHGSAMPLFVQRASSAAWGDEQHVRENRALYRAKYAAVAPILGQVLHAPIPPGGFYFWLRLPVDDQEFTRRLYVEEGVKVVPGSYLARDNAGVNPGRNHLRLALVPELQSCVAAAHCIVRLLGRMA